MNKDLGCYLTALLDISLVCHGGFCESITPGFICMVSAHNGTATYQAAALKRMPHKPHIHFINNEFDGKPNMFFLNQKNTMIADMTNEGSTMLSMLTLGRPWTKCSYWQGASVRFTVDPAPINSLRGSILERWRTVELCAWLVCHLFTEEMADASRAVSHQTRVNTALV